jgi:hypothetical protein
MLVQLVQHIHALAHVLCAFAHAARLSGQQSSLHDLP